MLQDSELSFGKQKKQEWIQHMLTEYFSFNKNKTHKYMICRVPRAARSAFGRQGKIFRPPPSSATADWLQSSCSKGSLSDEHRPWLGL